MSGVCKRHFHQAPSPYEMMKWMPATQGGFGTVHSIHVQHTTIYSIHVQFTTYKGGIQCPVAYSKLCFDYLRRSADTETLSSRRNHLHSAKMVYHEPDPESERTVSMLKILACHCYKYKSCSAGVMHGHTDRHSHTDGLGMAVGIFTPVQYH